MTDALLDALDRLRDTGPEFGGFLANHGPMAAEALVRLGADEAVPRWVDGYRTRLHPAPGVVRGIDADGWRQALGDERLIGDWTALLRRDTAELPWPDVLARWWPRLLPGIAASATHGVIRTGHAVRALREAGDAPDPLLVDELAKGLAYWAARYQEVPGAPALSGSDDAVAATAGLPRMSADVPAEGPGIIGRLVPLGRLLGFSAGLDAWRAPSDPDTALDELIGAAARVLAARDDSPVAFCHTVTAPAAVRLVLPVLPESLHRGTIAATWQVIGAVVAAFAEPRLDAESLRPEERAPSPDALVGPAVEHGDEHVIKLAEAARREHARTGDPTLLVAADRYRRRIPA
ncbi:MAG: questin oxidase family protein [Actinomycetota bacterium]|nr:questin oxidase family protein [Actinomycetota bacterium]